LSAWTDIRASILAARPGSPLPPDICLSPMLLIRNAANLG
jgi:hypothetical protein